MIRVAVVAVALATSACTWFDAGPPDRSCKTDRDCFRAQGETCNQTAHVCEVVDGGAGVDASAAVTP